MDMQDWKKLLDQTFELYNILKNVSWFSNYSRT